MKFTQHRFSRPKDISCIKYACKKRNLELVNLLYSFGAQLEQDLMNFWLPVEIISLFLENGLQLSSLYEEDYTIHFINEARVKIAQFEKIQTEIGDNLFTA